MTQHSTAKVHCVVVLFTCEGGVLAPSHTCTGLKPFVAIRQASGSISCTQLATLQLSLTNTAASKAYPLFSH